MGATGFGPMARGDHAGRMATTSWTTLGTIGGTGSARVDGAGRLVASDGTWSLAWTIGAEDRWHDPAETANVRQSCLGRAPVIETRMRVPGGDIVHRAFALHVAGADGGSEWAVVEVENDSAVPVAFAITRGGTARLVLPRDPSEVRDDDSMVFTLTHRATIRLLVGIGGEVDTEPTPESLPPLDAVLSGWSTQLDRGSRLVVPNDRFQEAIEVTRAHLLVDASRSVSPSLATVLDEYGLHGDARSIVARLVEYRFDARRGSFGDLASNASIVTALARHQQLAPDPDFARTVVDAFVAGVQQLLDAVKPRRLHRGTVSPSSDVLAALVAAPAFLTAAGEVDAASTVTAALANLETVLETPSTKVSQDPAQVVDEMLSSASPTWTWTNEEGTDRSTSESVRFASNARRLMVAERDDGIALIPVVPKGWIGQSVEAHDVGTRFGTVAFAVRWHGERPALLWEIEGPDPAVPVVVTCGLDPDWSSSERSGETLLAAPAV